MARWLVPIMAAALAACAGPPSGGDPAASRGAPTVGAATDAAGTEVEGSWVLTTGTVDGVELPSVPDHRVTLIIEGTELGGVSACNHYGARATMGADGFRLDGLGGTEMACRDDAMDLESAYVEALLRIRQLERDGAQLVGRGDGVELRFGALGPPPTADLVDTRWLLTGLVSGDAVGAPEGDAAWLELRSDGSFAGSTGCRSFEGAWSERGDQIITPTWGMDDTECPADLQAQDGHVTQVIGDGVIPTIDGDELTLRDVDGTGLTYRAAGE